MPIPNEVAGHKVIAYAQTYEFMDRIDAVVITEWDDPTPWCVRQITIVPDTEPFPATGHYFSNLGDAFTEFKTLLPR